MIDVSPKPPVEERYLGDGLYASYDGFYIKLRAPRPGGDHEVFLEPSTYRLLEEMVAELWGQL